MASGKYEFILFISGMSVKSVHAIENIKAICTHYLKNNFELRIIDINLEREAALEYEIFAIPTLIKQSPVPKRIILGDLSDKEKVLKILDLEQ